MHKVMMLMTLVLGGCVVDGTRPSQPDTDEARLVYMSYADVEMQYAVENSQDCLKAAAFAAKLSDTPVMKGLPDNVIRAMKNARCTNLSQSQRLPYVGEILRRYDRPTFRLEASSLKACEMLARIADSDSNSFFAGCRLK